jgi:hypothetical protein
MKRIFCLSTFIFFGCPGMIAQENPFMKISENYFRANPFDKEYSKFMVLLMNDPMIANKLMVKRTDTTFFSFRARYKDYSPYISRADGTEINLMEQKVDLGYDSLPAPDTIFIYQLLGYFTGDNGAESVKKEFNKFDRRFKKSFISDEYSDILRDEKPIGGMINYFVFGCQVSPVSISWASTDETRSIFSILFRFKIKENRAVLPIPSDSR